MTVENHCLEGKLTFGDPFLDSGVGSPYGGQYRGEIGGVQLRAELGTKLDGFKDVMKVQLLQLLLLLYSPQTSQNVINYKLRTLRLRHVTRISLTDTPSTRFLE